MKLAQKETQKRNTNKKRLDSNFKSADYNGR